MKFFSRKIKKSIKLSLIGDGLFDKIKLFYKSFSIPLRNRLGLRNGTYVVRIRMYAQSAPLYLNGTYEELLLIEEILVNEQYSVDLIHLSCIVDLGSNIGISMIYFALRYPKAIIFGCEPHPATFALLKKNVGSFGDRIQVYNVAITETGGNIDLYEVPNKNIASSIVQREGAKSGLTVLSMSMDSFIKENNIKSIDLLKFDIEGAELSMLRGFSRSDIVLNMVGEVHFDLISAEPHDFWILLKNFYVDAKPANKKGRYVVYAKHT